jgi:hypothetical protein
MFLFVLFTSVAKKGYFFEFFLLQFTTCKDTKKKRDSTNFILFHIHINAVFITKGTVSMI